MIHFTCLQHGLHRVAETVRCLYRGIDSFISSGKTIPRKVVDFHTEALDIQLPPRPKPQLCWGNCR